MLIQINQEIEERSSYDISFDVYENDKVTPLNPSSAKVFIFVEDTSPVVYVNDRDGSSEGHDTGLAINENAVTFHMSPADNQIVDAALYAESGYETHIIRFEIKYNADADTYYLDFRAEIRNLDIVGES